MSRLIGVTYSVWYNATTLSDEEYAARCAESFVAKHGYKPSVIIGPARRGIILRKKHIALYPVVVRTNRTMATQRSPVL